MSAKTDLLKGVDLFSPLTDAQIGTIAQLAMEKSYAKNDVILIEDDPSNQSFFLIAEGQVKVTLTSEDGREAQLAGLVEGDFFGEMSLLDGEPRSATVKAVTASRLLTIRRDDFLNTLRQHPDLALALLGEMSRRLRKSNRQISSLALMKAYGRVASTLLQLMEERGVRTKTQDGRPIIVIRDRPTQQVLAEMAGTTRETISRMFKEMERRGAIASSGKDLFILQESRLHS
jgi:CRP/FNR family transcriptional regulator/CRP/FNR family cyclic AMP-dependent transcriptional regulator